jgi:hypothetical protein
VTQFTGGLPFRLDQILGSRPREHSVEEDTAEGDLGPMLVAERIIHNQPDHSPGDQVAEDQGGQHHAQVIPLPRGGMEDRVGGIVMPFRRQTGGLPDLADRVRTETDDPARDQDLECVEHFDPEAVTEGSYQRGEARDKLSHGAGLHANSVFGVLYQPQDTESAGVCPLLLSHCRGPDKSEMLVRCDDAPGSRPGSWR